MSWLGELLSVFATTILPVLLVAAAGYVLAWFVALDGQTLGRILFYLASPALVFRSLYRLDISATALAHEVLVVSGVFLTTALLGWVASRGQSRSRRSGLVLASAIGNTGNMGIPISLFALGESGFALATLYYAITTFLTNSVGVVVASAGSVPVRTCTAAHAAGARALRRPPGVAPEPRRRSRCPRASTAPSTCWRTPRSRGCSCCWGCNCAR